MTQPANTKNNLVIKMTHECLHEEQIQGQSRAIERMGAELNYKKERLDELKDDNKRMEKKIDEIKDCVDKLVVKSQTDDSKLDKRLTAIETEQKVIKEMQEKNRSDTNLKIALVGLIIAILTLLLNYLK